MIAVVGDDHDLAANGWIALQQSGQMVFMKHVYVGVNLHTPRPISDNRTIS